MATTFKWVAPESIASTLTTELNALADGSFCTASSAIDNETDLYQYMAVELNLGTLDPAAGGYVDVWIETAPDGTNYSDHGKAEQVGGLLGTFQLDQASAAQRLPARIVSIPPLKFKLAVRNKAGVALNATGNTLKTRRFNEQGV